MQSIEFLGVYSGSFDAVSQSKAKQKKQYWYVWFMPREHRYVIANLNAQSKISPCFITPLQFGVNLIEEAEVKVPEPPCPDITVMQFYNRQKVEVKADPKVTTSESTILKSSEALKNDQTKSIQNLDISEQESISIKPKKSPEDIDNTPILVLDQDTDKTQKETAPKEADKQEEKTPPQLAEKIETEADLLLPKDNKDLRRENAKAVRLDKDIRQDLANALDFWKKGKKGVASVKIDAILKRKDAYVKAHKHTFTECAIQLRKINQNEPALAFALRCTEVAPEDSHTFFNAARMHFELKNYKQAGEFIKKALKLDPNLAPALKLNNAIEKTLEKISKRNLI